MKNLITAVLAIILVSARLYAAENPVPADKNAGTVKTEETSPARHNCADCPMHKKAAGHACPMAEKTKKHGGTMCPGQMDGVKTESKNIGNGVEIIMTAKDKETAEKVQRLAAGHHADKAGMNKGCACRVEGAETKIENTADGVKMTITAKTPETVKKIQESAAKKHCEKGRNRGHGKAAPDAKAAMPPAEQK